MYLSALLELEGMGVKIKSIGSFVNENVINLDTIAQLSWLKKKYPNKGLNELIVQTGTVLRPKYNLSYFEVVFEKSEVVGATAKSLKKYVSKLNKENAATFRKLATLYDLNDNDMIYFDFNVISTPKK